MARGGFARGMLTTAVGNFIPPVAAFVTAPILAHSLGVTGRGEVSAAQAPLLLFAALFTLGLPEAATYLIARSPRVLGAFVGRAVLLLLAAGVLGTVVTVALSDLLSGGDPVVGTLIRISALAIGPTLIVTVLRGAAIGLHAWGLVAAERSIASLGRLVIIAVLAMTGQLTVLTAVYVNAWFILLGGLVYVALASRRARLRLDPGFATEREHVSAGSMLQYGMGVWFGSLAGVLLARVDQLLMVPLSGAYELGLYAVAVVVAEIPLLLNNTVREVMFASDAKGRDDGRLTYAARMSGLICLLVAVAIGATMWWWLPLLFGADFTPALTVTLILLVAVVVGPPGSVAGAGLAARGLPSLRSWSLLVALVVNVVLVLALVPVLGATGAAVATLIGNVLSSNLNIYFIKRRFQVPVLDFYLVRPSDLRDFVRAVRRLLPGWKG